MPIVAPKNKGCSKETLTLSEFKELGYTKIKQK